MSVWMKASEQLPPLNEEVLILFKDKEDELNYENLMYGIASRVIDTNFKFERWTYWTEYSGHYEVVFWTRLVDMPRLENAESEVEG